MPLASPSALPVSALLSVWLSSTTGVTTVVVQSGSVLPTGHTGLVTTAVLLSVVISMGSVGLPGQVSFMATNMPVSQAMGLPVEPLGLLLALDTIPDVFATVGNVTADLTANSIVSRRGGVDDADAATAPSTH